MKVHRLVFFMACSIAYISCDLSTKCYDETYVYALKEVHLSVKDNQLNPVDTVDFEDFQIELGIVKEQTNILYSQFNWIPKSYATVGPFGCEIIVDYKFRPEIKSIKLQTNNLYTIENGKDVTSLINIANFVSVFEQLGENESIGLTEPPAQSGEFIFTLEIKNADGEIFSAETESVYIRI